LLVAAAIAVFGHVANGALRLPGRGRRSARGALAHLGALAATFALVQGLLYLFVQRPGLATNKSGVFDGPGFTELRIVSPVLIILAVVAFAAAAAGFYGAATGRWTPTLIVFGGWIAVYALGIWLAPFLVQQVIVKPAEAERQLPYIAHNLDATRAAYRLDTVEAVTVPYRDGLDKAPTDAARELLSRMPVFETSQLVQALQVLEGTTATRITDVDLDRYDIDGVIRPVMVATRNSSRADLPERGWAQSHLAYTHGNGIVAVPADTVADDGRPDVDELALTLAPEHSELYFGEGVADWYAIVGTKRTEQDGARFAADTGIALSSGWRRLVAALGLGDIEPFTSSELTDTSQLLMRRGIQERLRMLAPFVAFDSEAYPVVTDDRVVWVVDGYTRSATYPYSQFARDTRTPQPSALTGATYNYLRASIKATIDAYDGSVHLYRTASGEDDPIIQTWEDVFPGLVEPIASLPEELKPHLLYPPDLFTVQTALLGRYHVSDPELLFNGSDRWTVSTRGGIRHGCRGNGASPRWGLPAAGAPGPGLALPVARDDAPVHPGASAGCGLVARRRRTPRPALSGGMP